MANQKTIKVFLIDGDPEGRLYCELSSWVGHAFKIPRDKIKDCTDRPELNGTGIYFLISKDDGNKRKLYVGEAESILKRLNQQLTQRDFWHEVIVFLKKDQNLNKAHIKFLENRLHDLAEKSGKFTVENSAIPPQSSLSESDIAEMFDFIENTKTILTILGYKIFDQVKENRRISKPSKSKTNSNELLFIKGARGADAQGWIAPDGFLVNKGSMASLSIVDSMPDSFNKLRQVLIKKGILKLSRDSYQFTEDYLFSSPSTAAAIVMGRSANGLKEWKKGN